MNNWSLKEAVDLCRVIESICPKFSCHVALTGGTLYKDGERKDCDILFYRVRQASDIDIAGLILELESAGLKVFSEFGWVKKAMYNGKTVDLFFPENFPQICTDYQDII